jgi:putative transposase
MHFIKQSFAIMYRNRIDKSAGRIWQYRFWDHIIRNDDDLRRHIDYIHYNPVKHGLCTNPFEYQFSSIHQYKEYYQPDWGCIEPKNISDIRGE